MPPYQKAVSLLCPISIVSCVSSASSLTSRAWLCPGTAMKNEKASFIPLCLCLPPVLATVCFLRIYRPGPALIMFFYIHK